MLRHLRIPAPLRLVSSPSAAPSAAPSAGVPANLERHMAFIAADVWQRAAPKDVTYLADDDQGPANHESIRMQRAMLRWLYGEPAPRPGPEPHPVSHPDPKPGHRHKR